MARHSGKYISYLRVSTKGQEASGLGLEAQRKDVADWLNGGNWQLVEEVEGGPDRVDLGRTDRIGVHADEPDQRGPESGRGQRGRAAADPHRGPQRHLIQNRDRVVSTQITNVSAAGNS